ncbi:MAG TPA: metallophosphoesterase [Tepidisphaeraceae bacterium]|nr:metallophosphoesterase [Tepidisphaeraceae bacterium]
MPVVYLILLAVGLGDVAWWRWADRRSTVLPRRVVWRTLIALFIGSQLVYLAYFVAAPKSARRVHPWLPMPFIAMVYVWHLLVLPASLIGVGASKVVSGTKRLLTQIAHGSAVGPVVSRRQAILGGAAVAAPPLLTLAGVARAVPQLDHFRIRPMDLRVPGLPPNLDGLRIAHVSDIHVGRYIRRGLLPRIVEATNQLKADLVLFTGDLIDLSLADLDRGIEVMKQLDPRQGLAIIEGNHDLIEDPDAFDGRMKAAGLPLLVDEAMTIAVRGERVQLLGMRWGTPGADRRRHAGEASFRASLDRLLPRRESGAFPIVLAHHPHAFDMVAAAGLPLTLSGHTHGGQLMLSEAVGFGPVFFRYWSGLYRKGDSQLVVSNGVGNWFPLRVQAPAEIIALTLHAA